MPAVPGGSEPNPVLPPLSDEHDRAPRILQLLGSNRRMKARIVHIVSDQLGYTDEVRGNSRLPESETHFRSRVLSSAF